MTYYFPSCNFSAMRPKTARKLEDYFASKMPVRGCCRGDKDAYTQEDSGLYLCQACRSALEAKIKCVSIWEYLDGDRELKLPDYSGFKATIQDCWRDREHPEVWAAVRSLLRKMNVAFVDVPGEGMEKSTFCGDLHFEPKKPENIQIVRAYAQRGIPLHQAPPEIMGRLMREQVEKFETQWAITDCNRCTRGIEAGGGKAVHLAELVFGR